MRSIRRSIARTVIVLVFSSVTWSTERGVAGELFENSAVQVNGSSVLTTVAPGGDPALTVNGSPVVTVASLGALDLRSKLLLPFYLIDPNNEFPTGSTTFFSVVNESTFPVDTRVSVFGSSAPASPAYVESPTLGPQETRTLDLQQICPACPVEGFVVIETIGGEATLHGDYFRADGSSRVGAWRLPAFGEGCKRFSMRFYPDATFIFWTDLSAVTADPIAFVAAYSSFGGDPFLLASIYADTVAFQVSTTDLGLQFSAGHLEVEFASGITGHVSVATTFPSVSSVPMTLEATCTGR